jgi:hypothetical protein
MAKPVVGWLLNPEDQPANHRHAEQGCGDAALAPDVPDPISFDVASRGALLSLTGYSYNEPEAEKG